MTVTWDDAFLDNLRTQADPEADNVIAGLFSGTKEASSAFRALVVQQHEVAEPALKAFLGQGYTEQNALEVVLGIGAYTMSTLANRLTGAAVDEPLRQFA